MYAADYASSVSSEGTASNAPSVMYGSPAPSSLISMQESMEFSTANASALCAACGLKGVVSQTMFCSRRCSWSAEAKCPQCGRYRDLCNAYCSTICCQQALQANWCPCCGISQINSSGSCTNMMCEGSTMVFCSQSKAGPRNRMQHQLLPPSDAIRGTLSGPLNQGFAAGFGRTIVNIIRVNAPQASRKRYLAYRSTVESTLSHLDLQKYGHGGEGNEQRKFIPLTLQCGLGTVANGSGGSNIHCCGNPDCGSCRVLSYGLRLGDTGAASHYCTTSAPQSMCWCQPNAAGCKAMLVARVVIGNPEMMPLTDNTQAPEIVVPENPELVHCTVLTNNDPSQDGIYLFRDDAIDPQYIVIFA